MKTLMTILEEIWGLFVDDGTLAVLIIVWCALVALLLPQLPLPKGLSAPILFAGLIIILLENVRRSAARSARKKAAQTSGTGTGTGAVAVGAKRIAP